MNDAPRMLAAASLAGGLLLTGLVQAATPAEDLASFQTYFRERFPKIPEAEFANGVYGIDPVLRENWEAIEAFPPYETAVANGQTLWETPFADGATYADCFPDGPAIVGRYPYWDRARAMVITLPLAINECRAAHGETPYDYAKGKMADLTAYMALESRGQLTQVEIPEDDPAALAAYQQGKEFYFARRGQLNFSCTHCHFSSSGSALRTETLSPAYGHTTHWPVYRSTWGEMGTLHRRFEGCNEQVRAKPFALQGEEYRNLEFFMTYMSNGLELNGPGARK